MYKYLVCTLLLAGCRVLIAADAPVAPVMATVQTSLSTAAPQIRMFVFDGDANSYFASEKNATGADFVELVFDAPVALKSVGVVTGDIKGANALDSGVLEISQDGKVFEELGKFEKGEVKADGAGKKALVVRVKPSADLNHPLAIREFKIESDPQVIPFKYPVEVFVDTKDAPELQEWTVKAGRVCERAYQMICTELESDGFVPKTVVPMAMKNDYKGVAATMGSRIVAAPKYFKDHPKDVGAMVHEMVHVAQQYRGRGNPSWLVEGVADYIRNFKYEPNKLRPLPAKYNYNDSYQISARFLAFLTEKYDKDIVKKFNKAMREGKYNEGMFEELTKKTLPVLDAEWKAGEKKG